MPSGAAADRILGKKGFPHSRYKQIQGEKKLGGGGARDERELMENDMVHLQKGKRGLVLITLSRALYDTIVYIIFGLVFAPHRIRKLHFDPKKKKRTRDFKIRTAKTEIVRSTVSARDRHVSGPRQIVRLRTRGNPQPLEADSFVPFFSSSSSASFFFFFFFLKLINLLYHSFTTSCFFFSYALHARSMRKRVRLRKRMMIRVGGGRLSSPLCFSGGRGAHLGGEEYGSDVAGGGAPAHEVTWPLDVDVDSMQWAFVLSYPLSGKGFPPPSVFLFRISPPRVVPVEIPRVEN